MTHQSSGPHKHGHPRLATTFGIYRKLFHSPSTLSGDILDLNVGFHISAARAETDDDPLGLVAFVNG